MRNREDAIWTTLFAAGLSTLHNDIPWLLSSPTPSKLLIEICNKLYGIKVVPYDSYDQKIEGALLRYQGTTYIIYNCYLPEAHKTIAIGHELSHYILNAKLRIKESNRIFGITEDVCTAIATRFVLPGGAVFKPSGKSWRLSSLEEAYKAIGPWWDLDEKETETLAFQAQVRLYLRYPQILEHLPEWCRYIVRSSLINHAPFGPKHPHFRYL